MLSVPPGAPQHILLIRYIGENAPNIVRPPVQHVVINIFGRIYLWKLPELSVATLDQLELISQLGCRNTRVETGESNRFKKR